MSNTRESILFITPNFPKIDGQGDQIVSYQRLILLSKEFDIVLLTFKSNFTDLEYLHIKSLCKKLFILRRLPFVSILYVLILLPFGIPMQCSYFFSIRAFFLARFLIIRYDIKVVHLFLLRLSLIIRTSKILKIIDLNDSMTLNISRRSNSESSLILKNILKLEAFLLSEYEKKILREFNFGIVVSSIDEKYFNSNKIISIPLGVEIKLNESLPVKEDKIIAFTGNMFYYPNVEAVLWFYNNCWDDIKKRDLNIKFWIIGRNPDTKIKALASEVIKIMPNVKDISEILKKDVVVSIAPMKSGSGMQFKILEAFSAGVPVVCSSVGLGVIKANVGTDVLVADNPTEFINSVLNILNSKKLQILLSENGVNVIKSNYTWDKVNESVLSIYKNLMA